MSHKVTNSYLQKFSCRAAAGFDLLLALWHVAKTSSDPSDAALRVMKKSMPERFWRLHRDLGCAPSLWIALFDVPVFHDASLPSRGPGALLRQFPADELARTVLFSLFHHAEAVELLLQNGNLGGAIQVLPAAKRDWLAHVGLYPVRSRSGNPLLHLVNNPVRFRDELSSLLEMFWTTGFAPYWRAHAARYEAAALRGAEQLKSVTLESLTDTFGLNIEIDGRQRSLRALRGGYRLPLTHLKRAILVPSAFNTEDFWTAIDLPDGYIAAYIPYFDHGLTAGLRTAGRPAKTSRPADPALVFRALGDATRFALADLVARQALTPTEIAATLGVSKATITHHLHQMRQAGLLDEEVSGRQTLVRLRRQAIEGLSSAAVTRFFDEPARADGQRSRQAKT